jgi:hypothetical protein
MGKLTKSCIVAPDGWLFAGADFSALEERIGAILSQDPNRIKVYAGTPVYEITINNVCHHVRADSTISYDGKHYTGEQFHEYWNSRS